MSNVEVLKMCKDCLFYKEGESCREWITPKDRAERARVGVCDDSGILKESGYIADATRVKVGNIYVTIEK